MDIYAVLIRFLKTEYGYSLEELNEFNAPELGNLIKKLAPEFPIKLRCEVYLLSKFRATDELDCISLGDNLKKTLKIVTSYKYRGKMLRTPTWEKWCNYGRTPEDLWNILHSEQYYSLTDNARAYLRSSLTALDAAYIISKITNDMSPEKKLFYIDWVVSAAPVHFLEVELVYSYIPRMLYILKSCLSNPDLRVSDEKISNLLYHLRSFMYTCMNVDFSLFQKLSIRVTEKFIELMNLRDDDRTYLRDIFHSFLNSMSEEEIISRRMLNYIKNLPSWAPIPRYKDLLENYRVFGFGWSNGSKGKILSHVDRRYLWKTL